MKQPAVYMMANKKCGTIYTGVTAYLAQRVYAHKQALVEGFTKKYACKLLVFYKWHEHMTDAIAREKQIKGGSRNRKIALIECMNSEWKDLYHDIAF